MTDKREELISGSIVKLMFKLGIPGIIGMLVISLYSFVDAAFVGRYVGEKALGAISVAYAFTLINNGIAVLIGIGSASVLSRAIGRKDRFSYGKCACPNRAVVIDCNGCRICFCAAAFTPHRGRRRNAFIGRTILAYCVLRLHFCELWTGFEYGLARRR